MVVRFSPRLDASARRLNLAEESSEVKSTDVVREDDNPPPGVSVAVREGSAAIGVCAEQNSINGANSDVMDVRLDLVVSLLAATQSWQDASET